MITLFVAMTVAQTSMSATFVDQAVDRIHSGDYPGALILLDESGRHPDADPDRLSYLRGVTLELSGEAQAAIGLYDEGTAMWPDSPHSDDRIFRAAEATATLGEPRRALRRLNKLDATHFSEDDALKLQLVTGIAQLTAGRARRGTAQLSEALDAAGPDQVRFYQAKARIAWARLLAEQSADLPLRGGEKRVVRRMTQRAALVADIEAQVTSAARLQEPEWVLDGLLVLGQAYTDIGDAMLNSSAPRKLTAAQREQYDAQLKGYALDILLKGSRHYGSGIELAVRLGWQSRRVAQLQQAKDALDRHIESLDSPT